MKVGVVGYQGAIEEHVESLKKAFDQLNVDGEAFRLKERDQLSEIDGLIIPGGESTTIGKLMKNDGMFETIRKMGKHGIPILGTCAGLILLAKKGREGVEKTNQPLLELMDMEVERNAFGRQKESFETYLEIPIFGDSPFHCVFIRAPAIRNVEKNVKILGEYKGKAIAAEQDNLLTLAFHPELTSDTRAHEYFLEKVGKKTGEV